MREVFYGVISQGVAPYLFVMKENAISSFFGHRTIEANEKLYATLTAEILKSVEFGCRTFYFGGFGEFDELWYMIVSQIREENQTLSISRIYCVAEERLLRKKYKYFDTDKYEDFVYLNPSFEGWYKSIYYRNCAMIDASDYVIFYAEERAESGAYKAYKYAKRKKEKHIVNLYLKNI